MFLGNFSTTLDDMNCFLPPAGFAKDLSKGFYMIQGFDRNLWVLTPKSFAKLYEGISSLNLADPLVRMLARMILSTARESQFNKDGTIGVPLELKEFAQLKGGILIVGQGDYFEIWNPEHWAKQDMQLKDVKANASRFSSLRVVSR